MTPIDLSEDDYSSDVDDESSSQEEESNDVNGKSLKFEKSPSVILQKESLNPVEADIEFFLDSERKYLESICELLSIQKEIENTNSILDYPICIFDNVDELYSLHNKVYKELVSCKYDINKLCSTLITNRDEFNVYISFISNIPTVDKILEMNRQMIIKKFPSLIEDLRKPRMRLNFYVLTLESLLMKSPVHQYVIEKCILMLKNKLKEADTRLVIDSIHGVSFDLRDYGRVLFSSELTLKRASGFLKKRYQAILLENILLLARGSKMSSEYITCFPLLHMQLVHHIRGLFIHLKMRTHDKSSTIIFKAETIKLQQKWIDVIQSQIYIANSDYLRTPLGEKKEEKYKHNKTKVFEISTINITDFDSIEMTSIVKNPIQSSKYTPGKIPPLSFWAVFSSVEYLMQLPKFYSYEENLLAFIESVRHMNIKDSTTEIKNERAKETILLLKEFYTKRLVPSINLSVFNNEDLLGNTLYCSSNYFKNLITKLTYYFAVFSYDSFPVIPKIFLTAIETIIYLRNAFFRRKQDTNDEYDCDNFEKMFSEAVIISNKKLKRRYNSNVHLKLSVDYIHEGVLTFNLHNTTSKCLYVVLTKDGLFGFDMQKNNSFLEINLNLNGSIINTTSEDLCFQVLIKHCKEKYNFGCSTIREKNEWILALEHISDNNNRVIQSLKNNMYSSN